MSTEESLRKFLAATGLAKLIKSNATLRNRADDAFFRMTKGLAKRRGISLDRLEPERLQIRHLQSGRRILISARHLAYSRDIVENFDYYFEAVVPGSEDGGRVVDYSLPRTHVLARSKVPFYFVSVAEPMETTDIYLAQLAPREGDVVLDLGAYCGAATWAFSRAVGPTGFVWAFEPDPESFGALERNIEMHGLRNVRALQKGVWSSSTTIGFQSEGNMGSSVADVSNRGSNVRQIEMVTLNDFCAVAALRRVDSVKMDIEGSEVQVLASSKSFFERFRPRLIIEPHVIEGTVSTNEVCRILEGYGYESTVLPQAGLPLPLVYSVPRS